MTTKTADNWIQQVPNGFYIDGCNPDLVEGSYVVKQSKTRRYSTDNDDRGRFAIEQIKYGSNGMQVGYSHYSVERFKSRLDAAIALKRGGLTFTVFFINDIYKQGE